MYINLIVILFYIKKLTLIFINFASVDINLGYFFFILR